MVATFYTTPSFFPKGNELLNQVNVTFVKDFAGYNTGESASFHEDRAAALVKKKVAVPYEEVAPEVAPEVAKKTKKKTAKDNEPCPAAESQPEIAF